MASAEIVCWNGEGEIPAQFQTMLASGEWDCDDCEPQVHIHVDGVAVIGSMTAVAYDVAVGHHKDCKSANALLRRAAGAAGLN